MTRAQFWLAALVLGTLWTSIAGAEDAKSHPSPPVKTKEVRKVYGDGRHNAFTALTRFHGQYWLAFRNATAHNSGDGDIVVLRSKDAKTWTEALRLNVLPDDRDPQFLTTEKRLILYNNAMKGPALTAYAVYTDDGETWSKPQAVYEPTFIMWKPTALAGRFWAAVHKKDEVSGGKARQVHLVVSDDGLKWEKVSTVRAGNWESEATLHFTADKRAVVFLRQKYGSPPAAILEAAPPYKEWKARSPNVNHFSGHSVTTIRGVTYLLSRTMNYSTRQAGQMIYTFDGRNLAPYCELPAGGDCAYAEAVEFGDDMLVSYYSSHEGATNIYLAVVPLKE
jgi:hypothetical protein